jgi:hypothetical protein
MRFLLSSLIACMLLAGLPGCAEPGIRQELFGDWHETAVLFRDYQNNVLVATDSTADNLDGWRFKRGGKGWRGQGDERLDIQWTMDEEALELNVCTDQGGLLTCIRYAYFSTDADHIRLIGRYNETATTYTEGEFRLTRGKQPD